MFSFINTAVLEIEQITSYIVKSIGIDPARRAKLAMLALIANRTYL